MSSLESSPPLGKSARLSAIMHRLSGGQTLRAEDLAAEFDVSVRSIYRDMDALKASGLPIEATQGSGYRATAVTTLPPLHLSDKELEAMHLGLLAVSASGDEDLSAAAQVLSQKLEDALPASGAAQTPDYAVYPFEDAGRAVQHLASLRAAIKSRQRLQVVLRSGATESLRPMRLEYWGRVWSILGFGENHGTFVKVGVHDIETLSVLPGLFVDENGKGLHDLSGATLTNLM